jgi:hypothetical protein
MSGISHTNSLPFSFPEGAGPVVWGGAQIHDPTPSYFTRTSLSTYSPWHFFELSRLLFSPFVLA